ncbi:SWIM zinc finger family protein [Streptomyces sp. TRM 70351]|uniref:SWIM zinc finger family protein n=1 Tax=Streptomyces sp. TRM 70351 TaxID=3116552 RepID=UPI002E7AB8E3|nr:SWIM zinc finger family protein [Streptomyces sp. TRM 70351]MEE1927979.1 SWIM zinc finger family protein [Streptomyces sp. TRM 70351]
MTGQQVRWSAEQVLALAPDAASRKAGGRLAVPGPWSEAGTGDDAVWGLCRGSGSTPYRTAVDLSGPASTCTCPSRKFPCKHALGLLLLWASEDAPGAVGRGEVPQWAADWLARRRSRAADGAGAGARGRAAPADPQAARRRAERRAQRVAAGAGELEQRLTDLLHDGVAGADAAGYAAWDEMAARMVDAQAPGLAARIRELAGIPASGAGWPARLLAECALLHLLNRAVLGLDELPAPLAATVRAHLGFTTEAAALLADREAVLRDHWLVLGRSDTEEGRLAVRRFWLRGAATGRPALLLSFGAAGRAPELMLPVGRVLDAELAHHPSALPLRAALGERWGEPLPGAVPRGVGVAQALAAYGEGLRADPWLESWPVVLSGVVPLPGEDGGPWRLADDRGDAALPLCGAGRSARWRLAAVSGGGPVTVFGTCGHRGFTPHTVWYEGEAMAL